MSALPDQPPRLDDLALVEALESSQRLGMLGSALIADVIEHSGAFLGPLIESRGTIVDLGSGGGAPGLVIAWMRPDLRVVLVDRRATRTDHLQRLVHRLQRADQVTVLTTDASALPRLLSERVAAVVARGFGPPDAVLRAAVPILADDGILVVSEPPVDEISRWSDALLGRHGLNRRAWGDARVAVMTRLRR